MNRDIDTVLIAEDAIWTVKRGGETWDGENKLIHNETEKEYTLHPNGDVELTPDD